MAATVAVAVLALAGCAPADDPPGDEVAGTDPSTPGTGTPSPPTTAGGPVRVPLRGDEAEVVEVVDGDTLVVRLPGGTVERLRLVGINAPEDGECLADEATQRLADLVGGRTVTLVVDRSDRDRYDRLLRHVLVGERSAGEALVAEGLALSRAYPPDTTDQASLDAAQARAEAEGVGLWAPDACGPAAGEAVVVGAVNADPPGDESQAPNEEWVEVRNEGGRPVDLTGWGVRDESASHRYGFPDGFRLPAGAAVRLHTGCGPDTATDLHWCVSGSAVWNNDGDTAFLTDPSGNIVDQRPV
jgi:micrococcal nuclease